MDMDHTWDCDAFVDEYFPCMEKCTWNDCVDITGLSHCVEERCRNPCDMEKSCNVLIDIDGIENYATPCEEFWAEFYEQMDDYEADMCEMVIIETECAAFTFLEGDDDCSISAEYNRCYDDYFFCESVKFVEGEMIV